MKISVESCWGGGEKYYFRLSFLSYGKAIRETISCQPGDNWSRVYAKEAKDLVSLLYGVKRDTIRFDIS